MEWTCGTAPAVLSLQESGSAPWAGAVRAWRREVFEAVGLHLHEQVLHAADSNGRAWFHRD